MTVVMQSVEAVWGTVVEMAPYLLLGFAVAGVLSVFVSPTLVQRHLGSRGLGPVVKASLFGVPLPLCSCGVIPVAASLRKQGASRGATTSFLISTPQTGVDSILVTYGMLGPLLAVYRPVIALVTGFVGGWAVDAIAGSDESTDDFGGTADQAEAAEPKTLAGRVRAAWRYGFLELPGDLVRPLVAGIVVAGLLSVVLDEQMVTGTVGTGIGAMLAMLVIGTPVYVCATASVPIAAALIAKGLTPGAALVFLMVGPATNAATIATVWKTMGRKALTVYLSVIMLFALGAGLLLDALTSASQVSEHMEHMHGHASVWGHAWGGALMLVLGYALVRPMLARRRQDEVPATASGVALDVDGMTCNGCVRRVREAVECVDAVGAVDVDLKSGRVRTQGGSAEAVRDAIEQAGYAARLLRSGDPGPATPG